MDEPPEYVQLSSWEELIQWIERAQEKIYGKGWTPPKVKRTRKKKLEQDGMF